MKNETQESVEQDTLVKTTTGKERAALRLQSKSDALRTFYAELPTFKPSRQNKRWMARFVEKKQAAKAKVQAIRDRRKGRTGA